MTDPKTIFETGLKMEIEANKYYKDHADRVQHRGTQAMLLELADEEQGHINLFQAALDGKKIDFGKAVPAPEFDLKIGETLRDDIELNERSEPGDVLVVAIKAEMNAIRIYGQWAEEHKGTDIAALLQNIINEEKTHKYRLERMYDDEYLNEM